MLKVILGENKLIMGLTRKQREVIEEQLTLDNPAYSSAMKYSRNKRYVTVPEEIQYYENVKSHKDRLLVPLNYDIPFKFKVVGDERVTVKAVYPKLKLELRGDQKKALKKYLLHPEKGVICLPTGAGKTVLGLAIASKLKQKVLVITNRDDLLKTWIADAIKLFGIPRESIGVIKGPVFEVGKLITVATVQTLSRRNLSNLASRFGVVIVDETHHVPATTFVDVLSQFRALYRIGLTATLEREDGLTRVVHWFMGAKGFNKTESDDIMPVEIRCIDTGFQVKKVPKKVKRFDRWVTEYVMPKPEQMLKQLYTDEERNKLILYYVVGSYKQGNSIVVFTHRVDHAQLLNKMLRERGVKSIVLTGQTTDRERKYKQLESGKIRCAVATYHLVKEGINIKSWNRGFGVTPTDNRTECIQAIGRIRRTKKGKKDAIWYDFVDAKAPKYKLKSQRRLKHWKSVTNNIVGLRR